MANDNHEYLVINGEAWCESNWYSKICKDCGEHELIDWKKSELVNSITCLIIGWQTKNMAEKIIKYLDPEAKVEWADGHRHAELKGE